MPYLNDPLCDSCWDNKSLEFKKTICLFFFFFNFGNKIKSRKYYSGHNKQTNLGRRKTLIKLSQLNI